jgi:hypothetical protein
MLETCFGLRRSGVPRCGKALQFGLVFGILSLAIRQSPADTITTYTWENIDFIPLPGYEPPSGTLNIDTDNPGVAAPGSVFDFGVAVLASVRLT